MFLDKYKISNFEDFCLNKGIIPKINYYFYDNNIFNTVIYGSNDIGKYTIIKSILEKIFGPTIHLTKKTLFKVVVGTTTKEIKVLSSSFHYELALNNYSYNDKLSLSAVLCKIAEYININTMSYNVIVIKNAQYLTNENMCVIKNISEKYFNNIRFIMTCNSISKISKK